MTDSLPLSASENIYLPRRQQELGTGSERDTDMIREVLFDTNPWLLGQPLFHPSEMITSLSGITFAVSILHTLFDILAFKNDIQVLCWTHSPLTASSPSSLLSSFLVD
jgi:hypothetical protein